MRAVYAGLCLLVAFFALAACDSWNGLSVRNDTDVTLSVSWLFPGGREFPASSRASPQPGHVGAPVAPGATVEVGAVGGPPDPQPDVIVKAYDDAGTLVFCRRLAPSEYRGMTNKSPLSLKSGDVRCK